MTFRLGTLHNNYNHGPHTITRLKGAKYQHVYVSVMHKVIKSFFHKQSASHHWTAAILFAVIWLLITEAISWLFATFGKRVFSVQMADCWILNVGGAMNYIFDVKSVLFNHRCQLLLEFSAVWFSGTMIENSISHNTSRAATQWNCERRDVTLKLIYLFFSL